MAFCKKCEHSLGALVMDLAKYVLATSGNVYNNKYNEYVIQHGSIEHEIGHISASFYFS